MTRRPEIPAGHTPLTQPFLSRVPHHRELRSTCLQLEPQHIPSRIKWAAVGNWRESHPPKLSEGVTAKPFLLFDSQRGSCPVGPRSECGPGTIRMWHSGTPVGLSVGDPRHTAKCASTSTQVGKLPPAHAMPPPHPDDERNKGKRIRDTAQRFRPAPKGNF